MNPSPYIVCLTNMANPGHVISGSYRPSLHNRYYQTFAGSETLGSSDRRILSGTGD